MDTVFILLRQISIMGFLMSIGWVLSKLKLITEQGSKDLSNLLLRVVVPAVILQSFIIERTAQKTNEFLLSFAMALGSILLSMIVSRLVFRKNHVIDQFGTSFANAGFFAIPIVSALFGAGAVFYITSFITLIILFQWTYGVYLFTKDRSIFQPKKLLMNPIVISFALAMVLFFTQLPVPSLFKDVIGMVTPLNTPLAMIILGTYLAKDTLVSVFKDKTAYLTAGLRLIVIPLLTVGALTLVPDTFQTVRFAVLISAIAPVGVNVAVFAGLHHQDYTRAVRIVCLSTILSVITIPLIVLIAEWLWL